MQLNNLYPSDVTDTTTGITFSAFTENITGIADSMADAYLMGYLPPEMVAPSFHPVILSGGGDSVSAVFDNSQNYGWGYIFRQGSADGTGGVNYVNENGIYTRLYNVNPDYRFMNAAEMSKYCTNDTLTINIAALAIDKNYWDGSKTATTQFLALGQNISLIVNVSQSYTFGQWRDIIKNDTVFYSDTVQGHTIELRPSDFGDSNDPDALHVKFFESGNYVIRADIYNYVIGETHYTNLNSGYSNYIITPFVQAKISAAGLPDTVADVIPGTNLQHYLWMRYINGALSFERGQTAGANNYDYIPGYNVTFGGFNNGAVSVSDIDFSTASNYSALGFVRNWYFNYSNGVFRIVPTFTPLDIYHHMMLFHKHTSTPSGDYSNADTVTVFTNDDTPTMDTVSGTLSEIAARLRPWQIPGVDITSNTFTPEDIPEPTPPGDDEETGVSIIRPSSIVVGSTAGFLTQYVLSAANVAELGAALWSGIGDSNFWQNVLWTTLTASASFDVSSLLQYFISLRVYPFPLVNVSTYAGTGDNKIHIGRGAVPLTLGSSPNVGTISQYADILDAGTVTVPAYYGDFRDYAQTDIILHAPYIGTVNLAAADVIGATLHLVYAIDFAAGSCTAYLDISRGGFTYPVCLGSGVIGADVPLTADSASRRAAALFGLGDAALSNISQNASAERGAEGELDLEVNPYGMLAGAARGIMGANPIAPTMSGIGKGFDSFAGAQTAYIQIRRAITKNPGNQAQAYGRQTATTARLGDLSGFTVCHNVDVSGLVCDLETKTQIKRMLEAGVYI